MASENFLDGHILLHSSCHHLPAFAVHSRMGTWSIKEAFRSTSVPPKQKKGSATQSTSWNNGRLQFFCVAQGDCGGGLRR